MRALCRRLGLCARRHTASLFDEAHGTLASWTERKGLHPVLILDDAEGMARGQLQAVPGGTRLEGVAGMPRWVIWLLRFSTILSVLMMGFGASMMLVGAPGAAIGWLALMFGAVMVAVVLGVGLNVNNADAQVPEFVAQLEASARGAEPQMLQHSVDMEEEEMKRQRARQAVEQRRGVARAPKGQPSTGAPGMEKHLRS